MKENTGNEPVPDDEGQREETPAKEHKRRRRGGKGRHKTGEDRAQNAAETPAEGAAVQSGNASAAEEIQEKTVSSEPDQQATQNAPSES